MTIELSATELRIVQAALRLYAVNRAAQGKLDSQKVRRTDRAQSDLIARRYDTLVTAISCLTERLDAPTLLP